MVAARRVLGLLGFFALAGAALAAEPEQDVELQRAMDQPVAALLTPLLLRLGSIGAAGIPGGSLIMMGMVLTSVGLPLDGIALIAGVDRILDMLRTTVNITGDSVITLLVDKSEATFDKAAYLDMEL